MEPASTTQGLRSRQRASETFALFSDCASRRDLAEEVGLADAVPLMRDNLGLQGGGRLFFCIQFRGVPDCAGVAMKGACGMVELFSDVPHVQESGVAGGGNFSAGFASGAIQRGAILF